LATLAPAGSAGAGGRSRHVFKQFVWFEVTSGKAVSPRLAHQSVTQAVGGLAAIEYFRYFCHANQKDNLHTYPFDQSKTLPKMGNSLLVFYYN
jgi:hypothetical protein